MLENENRRTGILSTRTFTRAETIDSGDTIVLRFEAADGRPAAVLIPRAAAEKVLGALSRALGKRSQPPTSNDNDQE